MNMIGQLNKGWMVLFVSLIAVFVFGVKAEAKATPEQWHQSNNVYFELVEKSKGVSDVKLTKTKTGFDIKAKGLGKSNKEYAIVKISNQPEGVALAQMVNGKGVPVFYFGEDRLSWHSATGFARDFYVRVHREGELRVVARAPEYQNMLTGVPTPTMDMGIVNLLDRGLMTSWDKDFKGDKLLTRGEVADIIFKAYGFVAEGTNKATDVNAKTPYYDAIRTITSMGIMYNYKDGSFKPNQPITRGEMIVTVGQMLARNGYSFHDSILDYAVLYDLKNFDNWTKKVMLTLAHNGSLGRYSIITPYKGIQLDELYDIQPFDKITRTEGAGVLAFGINNSVSPLRTNAWK